MQAIDPQAGIDPDAMVHCRWARYDGVAANLVARLWTNQTPHMVSFGTDGPFFQQAGMDTVIFGPATWRRCINLMNSLPRRRLSKGCNLSIGWRCAGGLIMQLQHLLIALLVPLTWGSVLPARRAVISAAAADVDALCHCSGCTGWFVPVPRNQWRNWQSSRWSLRQCNMG